MCPTSQTHLRTQYASKGTRLRPYFAERTSRRLTFPLVPLCRTRSKSIVASHAAGLSAAGVRLVPSVTSSGMVS